MLASKYDQTNTLSVEEDVWRQIFSSVNSKHFKNQTTLNDDFQKIESISHSINVIY